jgi:hypothetical protein
VNESFPTGFQSAIDVPESSIDYLLCDVRGIVDVNKIEEESAASLCQEIFRVILGRSTSTIPQELAVIGLLAGMDDPPFGFPADLCFIVKRATDE